MKRVYWDVNELSPNSGPLGLISGKAQVVPAGTEIHVEQAKVRKEVPQYEEMAQRAGIFFFFEDGEVPQAPFFAVPTIRLFARDRDGNWYGQSDPLGDGVYRISPDGTAVQVSERMERFVRRLLAGEEVRELERPVPALKVYPSKEAAARAVELVPLSQLLPKDWKGASEE